ncbi:MAG: DEAD/DEAH box helicase [Candidatus Dojkabacteria bacterium]|jgi:transcription-repair coupling factor (superfamily II helicase)
MDSLSEKLISNTKELKQDILDKKVVTDVDEGYFELTAELLGVLLGKTVWLSTSEEPDEKEKSLLTVKVGDTFNPSSFVDLGYTRVERVWDEGEYAVLGDIVIVWPFSMKNIVRLSLFGKKVESIDIVESTSRKKIESVQSKSFIDSTSQLLVGNEEAEDQVRISVRPGLGLTSSEVVNLGIRTIPGIEVFSSVHVTQEIVKNFKTREYEVLYLTNNLDRYELETEKSLKESIDEVFLLNDRYKNIVKKGFVFNAGKLLVLTDMEVLGELDLSEFWEKNINMDPGSVEILKKIIPGDFVVHEDHGIGKYVDLQQREGGYYIQIAYAGEDKLFVPLSASQKLTKYIGAGKAKPILTGLNSGTWRRISKKAKERAEDIAKELLQLYALRETVDINPFLTDEAEIDEFEHFVDSFQFKDTDDQLLATKHLVEDFQKGKPMDRLLVGDVGYGKTEIATRAMYAVANSGFQVALLAPTTILVEQHYAVLKDRFRNTPFTIKALSRIVGEKEKQKVIEELKSGVVDIVVGTHALLSDSVQFKNLGLLVVDEEQKFGVKQKEKIKGKKLNTNVLSLTATPIPRTLNMALLGIRDISVLATPPAGRIEIENHFGKFDWDVVKDVITKELSRKGQVYFLHNRVETIDNVFEKLDKMFPQANVTVVHGQMNVQTLSKNMQKFVEGESKILVCTTIIENGLDIPNVNTLIVDDATMLGLAQMYQIRGRIGRSEKQAYAYFFYNSLRGNSALRLEALKNSQELGSGFLLSNRDLEIRGAGDILGKNQSGAINSVGYGLYSQMLAEAVSKLIQ